MAQTLEVVDASPELLEEVIATFGSEEEKELARQIVKCFVEYKLPVKVKLYHQQCMKGTYRILCYIKKSAEAVIINNKGMGHDCVSFQVRIEDRSALTKLDCYSDGVRSQIVNARDCGNCSSKCEHKKYVFAFKEKEYVKCRFICNNFSFVDIDKNDAKCLMGIIENEITYKQIRGN